MAGRVLLALERSTSSSGSQAMSTWIVDVPDGASPTQTAAEWAAQQAAPIGAIATVVDLSKVPVDAIGRYRLDSTWTPI